MGIFDSAARAMGSLRPLSDQELEDKREAKRLEYCDCGEDIRKADLLYNELHRLDEEMTRRANIAYEKEHPEPREPRHREHGWYLPNDD